MNSTKKQKVLSLEIKPLYIAREARNKRIREEKAANEAAAKKERL